jgi:ABC-2 type transport system permease protein
MIRAELLMLRKRASTWVLLGIWTVFGSFVVYGIPYATDPKYAPGEVDQFFPQSLAGTVLGGFPFLGGVFALMLGVLAFGSEYGWDTLKTLLTQRPGRSSVLGAKLAGLGIVLVAFSVALFGAGALVSTMIAHVEHARVAWPSVGLLVRAVAAGWLILAVWATLGVLLGIATRGTSLAIGIGILYTVVAEGLLSALTDSIDVLTPLTTVFLRANGYSIAVALGAPVDSFESAGPRAYGGPLVSSGQAVAVLVACAAAFLAVAAWLLQRRDVT